MLAPTHSVSEAVEQIEEGANGILGRRRSYELRWKVHTMGAEGTTDPKGRHDQHQEGAVGGIEGSIDSTEATIDSGGRRDP